MTSTPNHMSRMGSSEPRGYGAVGDARKRLKFKHRCFYRLSHRHHHPNGYLFECRRCTSLGLYPFRFVRLEKFWAHPGDVS